MKKIFEFYSIRKLGRFLDGSGRIRSICLEWSPRMKRGGDDQVPVVRKYCSLFGADY